jgi:FkbM family methyltransferase
MDIFFNTNPRFTQWLARSGALHEAFVVIDVGVLGGENPRWHFFSDHLVVHGFDAIKEVVEDLAHKNARSRNKTFHWFAIGNEDGERKFFFKPSNPTNSSFYEVPDPELQARIVPVRRLDTLLEEGVIPKAELLKVDVEGHERDVFWGAGNLLSAGILGVESETSFDTSIIYPKSHFGLVHDCLLKHGLMLFDLNFNRVARSSYHKAREARRLAPLPPEGSGKPATFNVLFLSQPAGGAERHALL